MSLLSWLWPFARSKPERIEPLFEASIEDPNIPITQQELSVILSGGPTMAGPLVGETTSIRCVDVFRCVSILSGLIASLKINLYTWEGDKRVSATQHRLYPLLRMQPNEFMSAFVWRELIVVTLLLWGNHYSRIVYDNAGRVVGFVPIPPWLVTVERREDGKIRYVVRLKSGAEYYEQEDMLHIPGLGFDGLKGLPVITAVGRQAIGTSLAMEEFTARLHANGVRPSGIGKAKEGMSPAAFARMKDTFDRLYSGVGNAGATIWVDAGTEWTAMQLSPKDAETLLARRFSTVQICNIFGVPAMLLNENADMTAWGSGIEQIMLGFLMTTINPWLERIESEINRKLFMKSNFEAEFDRDGLIVLDSKAKSELFSRLVAAAMMTPNEGRRRLNLPDMENGDQLFIQGGMVPLNMVGAHLTLEPSQDAPEGTQQQ
ncbi:MAG: phage portal protein [Alphaproteobacteria bacterium]|nr:phage portal protein [Alphaproteobacteria bacterium]